MSRIVIITFLAAIAAVSTVTLPATSTVAAEVVLEAEFLSDKKNIAAGKKMFRKRCARCHGPRAYPGKAPKLQPKKYKPEFVYRRITKGFRGMPSWKKRYNLKQRKSLTAYVMSKGFKH
ncbi:MAG: cytochrome c [Alphaproteobacteria bacterium]|nr:cytochrome c [Alphaproteobacteria bacterium]